ncbi:putative integral membrane family protein [Daldinia childiae]|uniref:putative integral membrane family protein n=1 Tax=Daldinia childiae TaxID=326645 RepID=UPI001445781C|nr:putative integral membrane family protein [Daldinia childiae]KAF3064898.1 putative integral membrane family protein [Daldinia childiae]
MAAQDPNAPTDSNGGALVATAVVMLTFSWLSVSLRSFVRAKLTNGFQWDDWLMLAAQANFTVSCALILMGVRDGLGRHNASLDQHSEIEALKYQALATATYVLNMWLIKLSIGIFLLRLATQKRYKYTLYASIVIVSIWSIVLFFWNIFQCNPIGAQWDYTILQKDPNARCVSADEIVNAAYALSVMSILSDWLYALLPIPMLWSVKMTTQAKMTVVVVLGLGVFASIATLVRLKFLADLTDMADILHAGTDAMVWTLIEPGVAIVASSLVTIRPLLRLWKIKGFGGTTGQSRPTNPFSNSHPMSRTNRSNKMPAFGSTDVTLVDVETGHSKSRSPVAGSRRKHVEQEFPVANIIRFYNASEHTSALSIDLGGRYVSR